MLSPLDERETFVFYHRNERKRLYYTMGRRGLGSTGPHSWCTTWSPAAEATRPATLLPHTQSNMEPLRLMPSHWEWGIWNGHYFVTLHYYLKRIEYPKSRLYNLVGGVGGLRGLITGGGVGGGLICTISSNGSTQCSGALFTVFWAAIAPCVADPRIVEVVLWKLGKVAKDSKTRSRVFVTGTSRFGEIPDRQLKPKTTWSLKQQTTISLDNQEMRRQNATATEPIRDTRLPSSTPHLQLQSSPIPRGRGGA